MPAQDVHCGGLYATLHKKSTDDGILNASKYKIQLHQLRSSLCPACTSSNYSYCIVRGSDFIAHRISAIPVDLWLASLWIQCNTDVPVPVPLHSTSSQGYVPAWSLRCLWLGPQNPILVGIFVNLLVPSPSCSKHEPPRCSPSDHALAYDSVGHGRDCRFADPRL